MLNVIVSAPGVAFASRIAWRNDPAPLSSVFVTVNVAEIADGTSCVGSAPSASTTRSASASAFKRIGRTASGRPFSSSCRVVSPVSKSSRAESGSITTRSSVARPLTRAPRTSAAAESGSPASRSVVTRAAG
jgi:hypothetical protein